MNRSRMLPGGTVVAEKGRGPNMFLTERLLGLEASKKVDHMWKLGRKGKVGRKRRADRRLTRRAA